jgi:hypothetical protein
MAETPAHAAERILLSGAHARVSSAAATRAAAERRAGVPAATIRQPVVDRIMAETPAHAAERILLSGAHARVSSAAATRAAAERRAGVPAARAEIILRLVVAGAALKALDAQQELLHAVQTVATAERVEIIRRMVDRMVAETINPLREGATAVLQTPDVNPELPHVVETAATAERVEYLVTAAKAVAESSFDRGLGKLIRYTICARRR